MEKGDFVVDSSVVTKWFIIEEGSDNALKIRDSFATGKIRLAVPTLLFYEVMNALRFSGVFPKPDLLLASKSMSKYEFEVWQPKGKLLELSVELCIRGDVTVYDACYIALASRKKTRLITEDQELLGKFPNRSISLSHSDQIIHSTVLPMLY